ncbi:MAG: ribosomal L7Ae/L30e/S12e/Gadd45 family protein [Firmicutes bacterium]|nr:ribosomal L7Ae/L30e/S12e/Gadd45 family protein [Bacillota bacterium]MBR6473304.1 ribosomal L7Ae/L30e/S12e/Gadd45 family protein [Bacillota bacterium]
MKKTKPAFDENLLTPEQRKAYYTKKVAAYMGFAAKAGKLMAGTNTCIFTMAKGKALLLIVAEDLAENGKEKVLRAAEQNEVEYRVYGQAEDLGHYTGKYGAGVFCVTDQKFAEVIAKTIDNTGK